MPVAPSHSVCSCHCGLLVWASKSKPGHQFPPLLAPEHPVPACLASGLLRAYASSPPTHCRLHCWQTPGTKQWNLILGVRDLANRPSSGQRTKWRWPGSLRQWRPQSWVPLVQTEIHCVGCRPDQPGPSPCPLGQWLLLRYMTSAAATGVKTTAHPTPGKQGEQESSLSWHKQPHNILHFAFRPPESTIFTIWALLENVSTPYAREVRMLPLYAEMCYNIWCLFYLMSSL